MYGYRSVVVMVLVTGQEKKVKNGLVVVQLLRTGRSKVRLHVGLSDRPRETHRHLPDLYNTHKLHVFQMDFMYV